jgi:hypothetical protein
MPFTRRRAAENHLSTQGSIAGEELTIGWTVKLAADGRYVGTTAATDIVEGVVCRLHNANSEIGTIPEDVDFNLTVVGYPRMRVKDGETIVPGNEISPSDVKGHIALAVATNFVIGTAREAASGTGQQITGGVGINGGYFKA